MYFCPDKTESTFYSQDNVVIYDCIILVAMSILQPYRSKIDKINPATTETNMCILEDIADDAAVP
jgi:hypothetical protein